VGISPVLMQLLQAGQGLHEPGGVAPEQNAPAVAGQGQPFALVLAQEAALAVAKVLGKPVLILPDGRLLLEFEPSAVPPGGMVLSPPGAQSVHLAPEADEAVPDGETADPEDAQNGRVCCFPFVQELQPALCSQAKLLSGGTADSEDPETPAPRLQSTAAYRVVEHSQGDRVPLKEAWSLAGASGALGGTEEASGGEPSLAAQLPPMTAHPPPAEPETAAQANVPAPTTEDPDSAVPVLSQAAADRGAVGTASPIARGGPPPASDGEGLAGSQAPACAPDAASSAQTGSTAAREAFACLTPEGVKLEVLAVETGSGTAETSTNPGAVSVHVTGPRTATVAHDAVPGLQHRQHGQASEEGSQPASGGLSESQSAPAPSSKVGEFLACYLDTEKAAEEPPVARSALEMPHAGTQRVLHETPLVAASSQPTPGASRDLGIVHAAGDVAEYAVPRELALRDSMTELAVKSVRYLVSEGEKSLRVRLAPESLGEVRVEIVSVRDELHLRLVSGNPSVRDAMENGSEGLRNALARDGVNVVRVTVSPDGGASGGYANLTGKGTADGNAHYGSRSPEFWNKSYGNAQTASDGRRARTAYHEGLLSLYA